jgi:hypothetical protein
MIPSLPGAGGSAALISTLPANGKRSGQRQPMPRFNGQNYNNFTKMNPL